MKVIKKFTAMQLGTKNVDDVVTVKLKFGEIEGPYYSQEHPKEEFDTEDEALAYAFKANKYATWIIVPVVRFDLHFVEDEN